MGGRAIAEWAVNTVAELLAPEEPVGGGEAGGEAGGAALSELAAATAASRARQQAAEAELARLRTEQAEP